MHKLKEISLLKTNQLNLKECTPEDWKEVLFLRSDKTVLQYINNEPITMKSQALSFIEKVENEFKIGKTVHWKICQHSADTMIGSICLWNYSEDGKQAELGYSLHPHHQNKGIMNEALQAVVQFGFEITKVDKIVAYTHKENGHSKRLLLKNNFLLDESVKDLDNENNLYFYKNKS